MPTSGTSSSGSTGFSSIEADLRARVKQGDVVLVVGAGVSVAATGNNPVAAGAGSSSTASVGLGRSPPSTPDWARIAREELDSKSPGSMLYPADKVTETLGGRNGREYRFWLRETVGSLEPTYPGVIEALVDIGAPILTTNYDGLLEAVGNLRPVTWRDDLAGSRRLLSGETRGVLHLHGFWDQPESVVLGIRSYDEVMSDERHRPCSRRSRH